jgi:hypothetical protein
MSKASDGCNLKSKQGKKTLNRHPSRVFEIIFEINYSSL